MKTFPASFELAIKVANNANITLIFILKITQFLTYGVMNYMYSTVPFGFDVHCTWTKGPVMEIILYEALKQQ